MRPGGTYDAVYAEQVCSSYAQLPLTLFVSVLNACLLAFVVLDAVVGSSVLLWVGLVAALSAARLCAWHVHCRQKTTRIRERLWAQLAVAGALASGVLWGSSTFLISAGDEPHQIFLALLVAGMCAGAATVHAAHFACVAAFIIPAIVPLALRFLWQGNRLQMVAGLLTGIFGLSLCAASLRFRTWFRETTAARLSLAWQTVALNQSNERLTAEIARHRTTEAKLHHAQKMEAIGRLTAGVAHDFNNLLMAIGGSAGLIASRLAPDSPIEPRIRIIQQAVERGATLTRQLLAFGRRQTLMPKPVDINAVLQGIRDLLTTTLGGYGTLTLILDPRPAIAMVDPAQLEQAILNLVINARDAMPQGGAVTIHTEHIELRDGDGGTDGLSGPFVLMSVTDTGAGMSEDVRLRAFDPFFTTKDIGQGSGLGLSQVYGLVQQSGGATVIDSHLGQGTTVRVYLPKKTRAAAATEAGPPVTIVEPPARAPGGRAPAGRRILVLDEERSAQGTLSAMLRSAGYDVIAAAGARHALQILRRGDVIHAMVVDLAMPDISGDRFADEVRRVRPGVPVLFTTGYAEPDALRGERWLLRKPFGVDALTGALERAMRVPA